MPHCPAVLGLTGVMLDYTVASQWIGIGGATAATPPIPSKTRNS